MILSLSAMRCDERNEFESILLIAVWSRNVERLSHDELLCFNPLNKMSPHFLSEHGAKRESMS